MLLRDLDWKPREIQHNFHCVTIPFPNGMSLYIERRARDKKPFGDYYVYFNLKPINYDHICDDCDREDRTCTDEFEAQLALDHYLQKYPLKETITP